MYLSQYRERIPVFTVRYPSQRFSADIAVVGNCSEIEYGSEANQTCRSFADHDYLYRGLQEHHFPHCIHIPYGYSAIPAGC